MKTEASANDLSKKTFRVYVLRLWRAEAPDVGWRASLEDPCGCERIGFASLEHLFAFLMEQVEHDAS